MNPYSLNIVQAQNVHYVQRYETLGRPSTATTSSTVPIPHARWVLTKTKDIMII